MVRLLQRLWLPEPIQVWLTVRTGASLERLLFLQDQMDHNKGAIYHVLLTSQYGKWTIVRFKGRLFLQVDHLKAKP